MIVQVIFSVKVGSNDHLIAVAPQTGSELYADLMRRFGRRLAGGKGLIAVVGDRPVFLSKPPFTASISSRAVEGEQLIPLTKL